MTQWFAWYCPLCKVDGQEMTEAARRLAINAHRDTETHQRKVKPRKVRPGK